MPGPIMEQLQDVFNWFDIDGSGDINVVEYRTRCEEADMTVQSYKLKYWRTWFQDFVAAILDPKSRQDWLGVYTAATGNTINLDGAMEEIAEGIAEMKGNGNLSQGITGRTSMARSAAVEWTEELTRSVFDQIYQPHLHEDASRDVDVREFRAALTANELECNNSILFDMITAIDEDGNGSVSFGEFDNGIKGKKHDGFMDLAKVIALLQVSTQAARVFVAAKEAIGTATMAEIKQMFDWYSDGFCDWNDVESINPGQFRNAVENAGGSFGGTVKEMYTETECVPTSNEENAGNGTIQFEELVLGLASGNKELQECWIGPYTHATGRSINL